MSVALVFRPLQTLPQDRWTPEAERVFSPFRSSWDQTVRVLSAEVEHLHKPTPYVPECVIEVDVPDGMVRLDGRLHANARVASPRVAVNIDSIHGALRYTCDRYLGRNYGSGSRDDWRVNVRAIALGLEALRKVERYGIITRAGQQYTGWSALPPATPMGAAMTEADARRILSRFAPLEPDLRGRAVSDADLVDRAFRAGAKVLHPDAGGDPAEFRRLVEARDLLTAGVKG